MNDRLDLQAGIETIRRHAKKLSEKPGVYRMLSENGDILYVGKAKALKKRVMSYTQPTRLSNRLIRMISLTRKMEFTETHTEAEALLLEASLIKKHKPTYNILLRDDKSFPYIHITGHHDFARLEKHRGAKKKKGLYFGPFASAGAVNRTINTLQKAFMIRNCTDTNFESRTRPCLQYHIKRCTAPCVQYVDKDAYQQQVDDVTAFLSGKSSEINKELAEQMQAASEAMDYESAAKLRDRLRALSTIQMQQDIHSDNLGDADVIAAVMDHGKCCIQVFFFRAGQSYGNRAYYPSHTQEDSITEILQAFVIQFYENKDAPKEIILNLELENQDLIEEALYQKNGSKSYIKSNVRSQRKRLIEWAEKNASSSLQRKMSESSSDRQALEKIVDIFDLEDIPQRIEVFDNSHTGGTDMVGAMIVAGPEGFIKNSYRKYNIKTANKQDDFDMMREVMARRYGKIDESNQDDIPDLILIDGGKGQLSAVLESFEENNIDKDRFTIVAISKGPDRNAGREEFHMQGRPSFSLPENDPTLFYLQRLRDEAHRFAIGTHRAKRQKTALTSSLDSIPGIGPKRKKALLMHFGSAKSVERAGLQDLMKVEGISRSFAEKIYDYFHG